jgi:site-specific recombinase XerC
MNIGGGGEVYVQMKNWNRMAKIMEFAPVEVNACLVYVMPELGGKRRSSWQFSICRQPKTAQQTEMTRKTMMDHEETENMVLLALFRNMRGGRVSKRQIAKAPKTWHAANEEKDDDEMQTAGFMDVSNGSMG